jgi:non-specific serine/threonine protein kinase
VLATSREALGVEGEVVWPVAGLAHPPRRAAPRRRPGADPAADPGALAEYDAVRLFVERAGAVQPGFRLTARNAAAVATITARLDGLPLALELAAAQVATLGVEPLAARLDDVFAVLARGRRTALPRHQTLRALLDWSYQLLGAAERQLLARLSVFRDAFTLEQAEAVCGTASHPESGDADAGDAGAEDGGGPGVLAALGRLAEQSLVEVREHGGGGAVCPARGRAPVRRRPPPRHARRGAHARPPRGVGGRVRGPRRAAAVERGAPAGRPPRWRPCTTTSRRRSSGRRPPTAP